MSFGRAWGFFHPAYHEIDEVVLVKAFHRSTDEALNSRRCQMRKWDVDTFGAYGRDVSPRIA